MVFLLAYERSHRVLRATAEGVISTQDLLDLDGELIAFLARDETPDLPAIRGLYDFSRVEAFAVPQVRAAERGNRPPIVRGQRVMVQSQTLDCGLLGTFAHGQREAGNNHLTVLDSMEEAHALLGMVAPRFEDVR